MFLFLLKGLLIGFAIAAPVGPIGVLCIRRTFAEGQAAGFFTGLGAATADAFYGAVAAFGLTAVSSFLLGYQQALQLLGGLFLCALGVKTWIAKADGVSARMEGQGLVQAYASSVILTLTNPATILSFVAVFAGAGLGQARHGMIDASALVCGVFLGSAAWWLTLSSFIGKWRRRYPEFGSLAPGFIGSAVVTGVTLGVASERLRRVNQISGIVLLAFGVVALATA